MEGIIRQVLRVFGFKCLGVEKVKSFYVCRTDMGIKSVKKVNLSISNILFQNHIKEVLYINGFANIDRFRLADGRPYCILDGDTYTVTDYIRSRESDFADPVQFREIVKKVAEMHFICKDIDYDRADVKRHDSAKEIFERHIADLQRYKKIIHKQSQLSDFDVTMLKHYDYYVGALNEWYAMTESDSYAGLSAEARRRQFICHNLLKEENVLLSENGEIYITDFSEASIDHHMRDLASIIKRYIRCGPADIISLEETISIYDSRNPIGKDELALLRALLIFPDKFLKICEKYYAKRRTWTPGTFASRMADITGNCAFQSSYLSEFYKGRS